MPSNHKLSNYKTTVTCTNGRISVVYHSTMIVDVVDGAVTLDSGGWQTVTTKRKMNQASNQFGLGYSVYQTKGDWFVSVGDIVIPFHDGMTFNPQAIRSAVRSRGQLINVVIG